MLDLNKPVQTRDGRPATIIATDVREPVPGLEIAEVRLQGQTVLAMVEGKLRYYTPEGAWNPVTTGPRQLDLVNVPEEQKLRRRAKVSTVNGTVVTTFDRKENVISYPTLIEFTVVDGKITAVEIIDEDC